MNVGLTPLPRGIGIHKPRDAHRRNASRLLRPRASSPRRRQGGNVDRLIRGICESAEAWQIHVAFTPHSVIDVVGLAVPPYGLPSADPTTPASTVQLRCTVEPSSLHSSGARWWSAHADDSPRSAFPLDLLPSRGWPLKRPRGVADDHLLPSTRSLLFLPATGACEAIRE